MDNKNKIKLVKLLKQYKLLLKQDIFKLPYKFRYRRVIDEMHSVSFQVEQVDTGNPKEKFQYVSIRVVPSGNVDSKMVTTIVKKLRAYYASRKMTVLERGDVLLVAFKKTDKIGSKDNRRNVVVDDVYNHLKIFITQHQLITQTIGEK